MNPLKTNSSGGKFPEYDACRELLLSLGWNCYAIDTDWGMHNELWLSKEPSIPKDKIAMAYGYLRGVKETYPQVSLHKMPCNGIFCIAEKKLGDRGEYINEEGLKAFFSGEPIDHSFNVDDWLKNCRSEWLGGELLKPEHIATTKKYLKAAAKRYEHQLQLMSDPYFDPDEYEWVGESGPEEDGEDLIDLFPELSEKEKAFLHEESIGVRDMHECMCERING
jgi:hypothetical protein